ncbi:MAG: rod shape-determining protein MreD, partial [Thermodesulfobacteriota bacterium]
MTAGSALLLFIVQTSFWDRLAISGAKPEFMVIIVVYLAFYHRYLEGAGLVLLLGYLTDFYSSLPLGVNLIGLALVHYLCVLGVRSFFLNSVLFQGAAVFS